MYKLIVTSQRSRVEVDNADGTDTHHVA